jgi:hypothetical protein
MTTHPESAATGIEFDANQPKPFRLVTSVDGESYQGLGIYPSLLLCDAPHLQLISQFHLSPGFPACLQLFSFNPRRCVTVGGC